MKYVQDELKIYVDAEKKKVAIDNKEASLFQLFTDLMTFLKQLQVFTPAGPSGTLLPASAASLQKVENAANALFMKAPTPEEEKKEKG